MRRLVAVLLSAAACAGSLPVAMKGGSGTYTYDDCLAEAERQAAASMTTS